MLKFLKRLWFGTVEDGELNLNLLSPPPKRRVAKREARIAKCIEDMKKDGTYLNVKFKKDDEQATTPKADNVTPIKNKVAK